MANFRVLAPSAMSTSFSGRTYSAAAGGTLDVPDFDVPTLRANGWQVLGMVGTTVQRPAALPAGVTTYVDTTLNKTIFHDGKTFRDHTGASV